MTFMSIPLRERQRDLREIFPYKNVIITYDEIVVSWDIVRHRGVLTECIPHLNDKAYGGSAKHICSKIALEIRRNRDKLPRDIREFPVVVRGI